ncbi:type II toxin-antitoxin system RelE/ParE family toxin [Caulobacter sp. S45]|uniref:type II toxin-antitoxin system RelE/ParE family toxin n=1 Tax=Caulobacter sp. S45 TaxID=1641861 RepID=UPI0015759CE3|nr:type II toxin-antitoxin system RelE/ParE family toxin [Caulobacter sp. S45]
MTARPIVRRARARIDIQTAAEYYLDEAGEAVAMAFLDAVEAAFGAIAAHPGAGSPRYAHALSLPGLRSHALATYPYLVFYVERVEQIDVLRVLHAKRDIPGLIGDMEEA